MQCANHLKQMGLGVHNFHDTAQGLPPSITWSGSGTSLFGIVYPFIEQVQLYDRLLVLTNRLGDEPGTWWWLNTVTDLEERKQLGSVTIYRCPSRRGGGPLMTEDTTDPGGYAVLGPKTDYALVASSNVNGNTPLPSAVDPAWSWVRDYVWCSEYFYSWGDVLTSMQSSPFRMGLAEDPADRATWYPRDTMAWWADGTSNQFIIGEKHIPASRLGKCDADPPRPNVGDCSYLRNREWAGPSTQRPLQKRLVGNTNDPQVTPIARGPEEDYSDLGNGPDALDGGSFGSNHPGFCQFLLGDGSVRAIPVTTSTNILAAYSVVDDGKTVILP